MGAIRKYTRKTPLGMKAKPRSDFVYPNPLNYTDKNGKRRVNPPALWTLAEITLKDLEALKGEKIDRSIESEAFRIIWEALSKIERLGGKQAETPPEKNHPHRETGGRRG